MSAEFYFERHVAFSDTDAMGVMHHAKYLHFCEEARVAWMRVRGLSKTHYPQSDKVLAVTHYQVWHIKPATFDDLLRVRLQVRRVSLKIEFQYAIFKGEERIAEALTWHVPVNRELRPVRPSKELIQQVESESGAWTETWLLNS